MLLQWVPPFIIIPAQAGIHARGNPRRTPGSGPPWTPAPGSGPGAGFAGVTITPCHQQNTFRTDAKCRSEMFCCDFNWFHLSPSFPRKRIGAHLADFLCPRPPLAVIPAKAGTHRMPPRRYRQRESTSDRLSTPRRRWVPACAGMTGEKAAAPPQPHKLAPMRLRGNDGTGWRLPLSRAQAGIQASGPEFGVKRVDSRFCAGLTESTLSPAGMVPQPAGVRRYPAASASRRRRSRMNR